MTEEQGAKQGVPLELRPWVWMDMCGAARRQKKSMPGYFEAMLQRGEVSSECAHQIELVRSQSRAECVPEIIGWGNDASKKHRIHHAA